MNLTDVQNLALALVGAKSIVSQDDNTKAARLTKSLTSVIVKSTLELPYDWHPATVLSDITGNLTTTPTVGQYSYRYRLPEKCLRVIAQVGEDDLNTEYDFYPELYVDSNGKAHRCILSDESSCFIKYIYHLNQDSEINLFPGWLGQLIALRLAIVLCEPLKQDKQKKNQLIVMYGSPIEGWLGEAIKSNARYAKELGGNYRYLGAGNTDVVDASNPDVVQIKAIVRE